MHIDERRLRSLLLDEWRDLRDPAHDIGHVERVVHNAKTIADAENGDLNIIVPAAWLHDVVSLPKNHPNRAKGSVTAADRAIALLSEHHFPETYFDAIHHAIAAHSFSANIPCNSLEAKIVQDADRLDALGAIGIARTFSVCGQLGRYLFDHNDPSARNRTPDDTIYGLDHFQIKLFKIAETLHTQTARAIAADRVKFMSDFMDQIVHETIVK